MCLVVYLSLCRGSRVCWWSLLCCVGWEGLVGTELDRPSVPTHLWKKKKSQQIKLIREKLAFKTLIDLRSEKELAMDDQKNSTVYDGTLRRVCTRVWGWPVSFSINHQRTNPNPKRPGYDTWSWGKGAKTCRIDSPFTSAAEQKAAKQRHFISVIDESVYQRGVFKRLGKRKKARFIRYAGMHACIYVRRQPTARTASAHTTPTTNHHPNSRPLPSS